VTASAHVPVSAHAALVDAFACGWAEGAVVLATARKRLHTSAKNGTVRVMRLAAPGEDALPAPLDGLVDVGPDDAEFAVDALEADPPELCLVGPSRNGAHMEGCAHACAWDIFDDEL
jgi:hypothetical protein